MRIVPHVVDIEPSSGRGHELKTSRKLIRRAAKRLGRGFATHLGHDALMLVKADFAEAVEKWGCHLLVKTQEETEPLIADTKELWSAMCRRDLERAGVEIVTGVDAGHAITYEVYAQGEISWQGLRYSLKLAWVRETHLKGKYKGQTLSFWAATTDQSLTAAELREIAHERWMIEIAFKEANEQVGSKKAYIQNAHAKEALLLMWFLGMALASESRLWLGAQSGWKNWSVKKTKKLLSQVLFLGFPDEALRNNSPP